MLDEIRKEAGIPWHQLGTFKPWMLPLSGAVLGGGSGALLDRENRFRGGLIGAGAGALAGYGSRALLNRTLAGTNMQRTSFGNSFLKRLQKLPNKGKGTLTSEQMENARKLVIRRIGGARKKIPYETFRSNLFRAQGKGDRFYRDAQSAIINRGV